MEGRDILGADGVTATGVALAAPDTGVAHVTLGRGRPPIVPRAGAVAVLPVDGQGRHGAYVRPALPANTVQTLEGVDLVGGLRGPVGPNAPTVAAGLATLVLAGQGRPPDTVLAPVDVGAVTLEGAPVAVQTRLASVFRDGERVAVPALVPAVDVTPTTPDDASKGVTLAGGDEIPGHTGVLAACLGLAPDVRPRRLLSPA